MIESQLKIYSKLKLFFINAHVVNVAYFNKKLQQVLRSPSINFADGIGLWIAGKLLYQISLKNFNGTDFGITILEWCARNNLNVFFFGATEGIAKEAKIKIENNIVGLKIVGTHPGKIDNDRQKEEIINKINSSGTHVLYVCLGVPKQEIWIHENIDKLNIKLALGLGAFFDFHAKKIKRAPTFMRVIRMEWLYRLYKEPKRLFIRYVLGNPFFLINVLIYKIQISFRKKT